MGTILYNDAAFRAQVPAYSAPTSFPEATLQAWWNVGINYINNVNGGCYCGGLSLPQQVTALNWMTAHLQFISALIAAGQVPGVMTNATIDKVSITIEPPPAKNQWQYWLQCSPYGAALLALLQVQGAGGLYFNSGIPAQAGFSGGFFGCGGGWW